MDAEEFYQETINYGRKNINPENEWVFQFAEAYHQEKAKEELIEYERQRITLNIPPDTKQIIAEKRVGEYLKSKQKK